MTSRLMGQGKVMVASLVNEPEQARLQPASYGLAASLMLNLNSKRAILAGSHA